MLEFPFTLFAVRCEIPDFGYRSGEELWPCSAELLGATACQTKLEIQRDAESRLM